MISPQTQYDLSSAKEYFREHLAIGDYYAENQCIAGDWFGDGAKRLSLSGKVTEHAFVALCSGDNPVTNERLTQRRNTVRCDGDRLAANRRIFYDFTFSPPKSFSVVALMRDSRLVDIHANAVRVALGELERYAETRIRRGSNDGERATGNVIAACFQHDTSRELDPQLHTHCVVFNATFDPVESRWKALHNGGMLRARKYAEAVYDHELTRGLSVLGYPVKHRLNSFEIANVPKSVVQRFSKRRQQIDDEVQRRREVEGEFANEKEVRDQVAHSSRRRKMKHATAKRLRGDWELELTPGERELMSRLKVGWSLQRPPPDLAATIESAEADLFDRRSIVAEHDVMANALTRVRGEAVDIAVLREAVGRRPHPRDETGRSFVSRELLELEHEMIETVRRTRRQYPRLLDSETFAAAHGSAEQQKALHAILSSKDLVTVFRGGAGTGKSFTLKQVVDALRAAGGEVVGLAPQWQQIDGLRDGCSRVATLSGFLENPTIGRGSTVILDEAGQVGIRQMHALISAIRQGGGRVILSGDTRQHGAVAASDALKLLETYGKVRPVGLRTIRRQDPKLGESRSERKMIHQYRRAVRDAADGKVQASFARLDSMGSVVEVPRDSLHTELATRYVATVQSKRSALVVTQTRAEVANLNGAIRTELKSAALLEESANCITYRMVDATDAAKTNPATYEGCSHVVFLRRYGRFRKGDIVELLAVDERGVTLRKDGRCSRLGYKHASRFCPATAHELEIAVGDRLQLKFNGKSAEGERIANGEIVTVRQLCKDGSLVVASHRERLMTLTPEQRLLNYGYAVTSYSAQGKTVDTVLFSDAGCYAATNRKQWYVTISRGRRNVVILTPDKEALRRSIHATGDRPAAIDRAGISVNRAIAAGISTIRHNAIRRPRLVMSLTVNRAQLRVTP